MPEGAANMVRSYKDTKDINMPKKWELKKQTLFQFFPTCPPVWNNPIHGDCERVLLSLDSQLKSNKCPAVVDYKVCV